MIAVCRLSDKLWPKALNDSGQPGQSRLALNACDRALFVDILKNPAALDKAAPIQPTTTQRCIWANLKVGADMLCHIMATKMWQDNTAFICQLVYC